MQIETVGTYLFEIGEASLGFTKKSNFPQAILRLKAVKKYVNDPTEVEHFKANGVTGDFPQYVDYSTFDQSIVGFLVLYNSADEYSPQTALLNAKQFSLATGWEPGSFDVFTDGSLIGKQILGRVEESTYEGKTKLQVNWIDSKDASPEPSLKPINPDDVKKMNSKFKGYGKTAKPAVPAAPKAVQASPPQTPTSAPTAAVEPSKDALASIKRGPGRPPKQTAPPAIKAPVATAPAVPGCTKQEAWDYVQANKGDIPDGDVTTAFMDAAEQVGGNRLEEVFTTEDWGKVRDQVMESLTRALAV